MFVCLKSMRRPRLSRGLWLPGSAVGSVKRVIAVKQCAIALRSIASVFWTLVVGGESEGQKQGSADLFMMIHDKQFATLEAAGGLRCSGRFDAEYK